MKKLLLTFGALLTTIVVSGCSGTPQNQTAARNVQQGNSVESEAEASENAVAKSPTINAETVRIGSIDWFVNYDDALAYAKQARRPVWLHFGENPG